jgi:DNA-nicking Smr family endonuclease
VKRPLRPDELRLWARIAATVRPGPGREPRPPQLAPLDHEVAASPVAAVPRSARRGAPRAPAPLEPIEPGRMRRLQRGRDPLGPRLDLHGLDQDQARARLVSFLHRVQAEGWRAALVITGKGLRGGGVLRRQVPEWLTGPSLRPIVAGVGEAHPHHGGEGALYIALKRRSTP